MGIDTGELRDLESTMMRIVEREFPQERKKFLRKEGNKLRRAVIKKAKAKVRGTGWIQKNGRWTKDKTEKEHLIKRFKRGKVYNYAPEKSQAVRVFNNLPHAHLVEDGHVMLNRYQQPVKNGQSRADALHIMRDSRQEFEPKFKDDAEEFLEEMLERL